MGILLRGTVRCAAAAGAAALLVGLLWARPAFSGEAEAAGSGSGAKSADEVAKELANPNNDLAKLTLKMRYTWYTGDLPDADDQSNASLLFQPVFPFGLGNTESGGRSVLFLRPAIPMLFEQPVPGLRLGEIDYDEVTALGDIGFDLAYGVTEKSGLIWALGMVGTLPTATDGDVAGKQLRLGPEALLAKIEKWGLYGIFPSHQWDVTGWGDADFSTSQCQFFLTLVPGGGWTVGSTPICAYDWESHDWTIPLNLVIGRTIMIGKLPVKLEFEANYYLEQADAFGPEWMIGFNVTPVVDNFIERWVRGLF